MKSFDSEILDGRWVGASFNRYSIRLTTGSGKASRKNTSYREKKKRERTFTSDASPSHLPGIGKSDK